MKKTAAQIADEVLAKNAQNLAQMTPEQKRQYAAKMKKNNPYKQQAAQTQRDYLNTMGGQ